MMRKSNGICHAVALFVLGSAGLLSAETSVAQPPPQPPKFSVQALGSATTIAGWRQVQIPKIAATQYSIVMDTGSDTQAHVLQADSSNAASSLLAAVNVDLKITPILQWRWRTATVLKNGNVASKAGDDYPLRVYVVFDVPLESLPFGTRTKIRMARSLFGADVPVAALCYVWDARQPVGTTVWNAYTDRLRMLVLQSGALKQNQWVRESRDVAADFKAAFGFDAPKITAVLVGADTDNTKETSRSWFGDLSFSAKILAENQAK